MPAFIIDMPNSKPVDITKAIKKDGPEKALKDAIKKTLQPKKEASK
jgi:hypothetical protein|tara:strand:- start:898 stop:1035 length:138 start_codon:yes stop_codon:yes gene_type:complete